MAPSDEARQMLTAATKDWRALAGMTDPNVFADEIFGFHAQQATEKAKGLAVISGHSISANP